MKALSAHEQRVDSAAVRAHTYIVDLRLVVTCRSMNSKHGVASSAAGVLKQFVGVMRRVRPQYTRRRVRGRLNTFVRNCESRYDAV